VSLGAAAERFETRDRGVVLTLSDGRTAAGDLLVGADGVSSVVRRALHPDEPPPRPSRWLAVRGVVAARRELGDCDAIAWLGPGLESAAVRASDDAVYWFMSLLARDVPAARPPAKTLALASSAAADPVLRRLVEATPEADVRLDDLLQRPPLARWGNGCVTLLGDAAHPVLPHTGQGAALALEDAVALGLALRRPPGDIPGALRRYEAVRAARTRGFIRLGPRLARVTTTRNPVIAALRTAGVRHAPASRMLSAFFQASVEDVHAELRWSPGRSVVVPEPRQ
jgi:2-polyprenyl-6-methoxyphenol hydroxylase-like FAD-dependent oxidoreductase